MNTEEKSINQIITALMELEAKGCHNVFFEYGNGTFRIRIFKGEVSANNVVYEKTVNPTNEQATLEEITKHVDYMKYHIKKTSFMCHRREFIKGQKSGEWEEIKPVFEFGENATQAMVIDGSGYFIDDPDNGLQYFVNMKQDSNFCN